MPEAVSSTLRARSTRRNSVVLPRMEELDEDVEVAERQPVRAASRRAESSRVTAAWARKNRTKASSRRHA